MANSNIYEEDVIELQDPDEKGSISLEHVLKARRCVRKFDPEKIVERKKLAQLLWAAQGLSDSYRHRTAPSAGATYPIELYLTVPNALFHYIPEDHVIMKKKSEELRKKLSKASFYQDFIRFAPLSFIICAKPSRTTSRYQKRGKRYVVLEAGHVAENILLQVKTLGLDAVIVGAFDDKKVAKLIDLPKDQEPICIVTVGYKYAE